MTRVLDLFTGWTLFGGLVLGLGAIATRWFILPRARRDAPEIQDGTWALGYARRRRAAKVGVVGAALTAVGMLSFFGRQLRDFRDPFVPWTEDAELLLSTSWGTTWKVGLAGTLVLLIAMVLARRGSSAGWWLASGAALALAAFPAFTGHASGVEDSRAIALIADWLHVVAAGAWIGGLAAVLYVSRLGGADEGGLADLVPPFSSVAITAVAVLVVSGGYASWLHVGGLPGLVSTSYGRLLLGKLALVGVVLAIGARNNRVLTSRLDTEEGSIAMRRSATAELVVAQLVLLVSAVLVRTSPM